MNTLVPLALYGWVPFSVFLFVLLSPRTAVLTSILGGWLFLPQASLWFSGLPDYDRFTAVSVGALLGTIIFDASRLTTFQFRPYDFPILIWCLVPFASSISNGLGPYDGVSGTFTHVVSYGIPYFLGRVYCSNREGANALLRALIIAGLVYVPLIFIELRLSPQLHRYLYGAHPTSFHKVWRWGGYRPWVFLSHGIELGALMASVSTVAVWVWRSKHELFKGRPIAPWIVFTLVITTALSRAANGWAILLLSSLVLFFVRRTRRQALLMALVLSPPLYVSARVLSGWTAQSVVETVDRISESRARSLGSRLAHETILIRRACERPLLGWGTYNRNRSREALPDGAMGHRSITDSLWIIVFGQRGLVGLVSLWSVLLLPLALFIIRVPVHEWLRPEYLASCVLAVVVYGFAVDCLVNSKVSPIYFVCAGAVLGFHATHYQREVSATAAAQEGARVHA